MHKTFRTESRATRSDNGKSEIQNSRFSVLVGALLLALSVSAEAQQQANVYRVGVILQGGSWYAVVDELRDGLNELGFKEGRHFVLEICDTKGDLKAVEAAAKGLVQEKVNLLYTLATTVTTATRRATAEIPIVFCVGADPVAEGLVDSIAKPGGRLTGVHFLTADLTAKRLEIMKEILPKASRVITFMTLATVLRRKQLG